MKNGPEISEWKPSVCYMTRGGKEGLAENMIFSKSDRTISNEKNV